MKAINEDDILFIAKILEKNTSVKTVLYDAAYSLRYMAYSRDTKESDALLCFASICAIACGEPLRPYVEERIKRSEKLSNFRKTILKDCDRGDDHMRWILWSDEDDLLSWVQSVEEENIS